MLRQHRGLGLVALGVIALPLHSAISSTPVVLAEAAEVVADNPCWTSGFYTPQIYVDWQKVNEPPHANEQAHGKGQNPGDEWDMELVDDYEPDPNIDHTDLQYNGYAAANGHVFCDGN